MGFRSNEIMHGEDSLFYRSLFKPMGYSDYGLDHKPLIGVVNMRDTCVPRHFNLNQVDEFVKKRIYSVGGAAVKFGTIGCCDSVAQGHISMNYILPSREIICNSVEVMVQAHGLDGTVLLASCDKIIPGILMIVARLDIPAIACVGDPMSEGTELDGRKSDLTSIGEVKRMTRSGKITEDEYRSLENTACPGCGSYSSLGTADSMCCISEAVGMSLPGSALIPAPYRERLRSFFEAGRAVVNLVMNNVTAKQVIIKESIRNAIKVTMAICGPTSAVLHIVAITSETRLDINVVEELGMLNLTTPQIIKANPAVKWDIETSYWVGGIPRVMGRLGSITNRSAVACTGKSVGEDLRDQVYWYPENREIIKTVGEPFPRAGGVAVLSGNLAPDVAISKPGAIGSALHRLTEKTRCYNSEEEMGSAILSGEIQEGEMVVIRYEGPKGGSGMREMSKAVEYIYDVGLTKDTALIADGRFSGTNSRYFVGHILPEAAGDGSLAFVEDGDEIMIDVAEGKFELRVFNEIISARRRHQVKLEKEIPDGYLKLYSKVVSSADKDTIIQC